MKRGRIAAILGVALILGAPLTALAFYNECPCYRNGGCICTDAGGNDCSMILAMPEEIDCENLMSQIRESDCYIGEDDDYFYFSAVYDDDPEHGIYGSVADPNGTYTIAYPKEWIEDWIEDGCTTQQP